MAIDRLIRNVVVIASVSVAATFIAPNLLTYTVMRQDLGGGIESQAPSPKPPGTAAAKPTATSKSSSSSSSSSFSSGGGTVTLRADALGGFSANPIINGHAVRAVVDTGATTVAISPETARRLGVQPSRGSSSVYVSTANGVIGATPVMLDEIMIGDIIVRDVEAVIIPGGALDITLLGMSFLKRLHKFEMSGGKLVLTE